MNANLRDRFGSVMRGHGLKGVAAKLVGIVADRWFEWRYGLDTIAYARLDGFTINTANRENATAYQGSRLLPLRKLFPALRQIAPGDGALVDIGCGKGKVLLVAALTGVRKVRGVEFAHELCVIARRNWEMLRARSRCAADFQVIEGDVTTYDIKPDETMFYVFNPFNEIILAKVVANIAASVKQHPRKVLIVICFLSEHYRKVLAKQQDFAFDRDLVFGGYSFSVFSNRPGGI